MILAYSFFVVFFNMALLAVLNVLYWLNFKRGRQAQAPLPKVSILIAVRNEEDNIPNLLSGLEQLDYPGEKLEIIIGNDGSEDHTLQLLCDYSGVAIKVVDVNNRLGELKGKMNVLAQLGMVASGDCLLFTDGDMNLNKNWVREMVAGWQNNSAMVAGFTGIIGCQQFHHLQNVDLVFAQGMLKVLSDMGLSMAVMGNNMIVDKKKYDGVGGYQGLPFSIVEDVALMRKFVSRGYDIRHHYSPATFLVTTGCSSWRQLMGQRKRWMGSVGQLPVWLVMVMFFKFSFLPCLLYISLHFPPIFLLFLMKMGLSLLFFQQIAKSVEMKVRSIYVLLYEVFEPIVYFSTLVYTLLPFGVIWKGRKYD